MNAIGEFMEIAPGKLDSKVKLIAARASSAEKTIAARLLSSMTFSGAQSRNSDSDMIAAKGTNRRST